MLLGLAALLGYVHLLAAQFPPEPSGVTVVRSRRRSGVTISFKETYICETTPGVRAYSGYVNLPASLLGTSYNISTFFWYFEARDDPQNAPLAMYLAGGPGQSSMYAVTGQGGPCYVNRDSKTTRLNPWSWNNKVNVLYVDQPVQTGFSYDTLVTGILKQVSDAPMGGVSPYGIYEAQAFDSDTPFTSNSTLLYGRIPSQVPTQTASTTQQIVPQIYQFTQTWINEFPKYRTRNKKISLWTHSAGGQYGPAIFAYFDRQNEKIKRSRESQPNQCDCEGNTILELDTLGLLNAGIDNMNGMSPQYAHNNTYGLQVISDTTYLEILNNIAKPGGCKEQALKCRNLANQLDPQGLGNNKQVNQACSGALIWCFININGFNFANSARSAYDISQLLANPFPYGYTAGYFNQQNVQKDLGVSVNFTAYSNLVEAAFFRTGDAIRGNMSNLNYVLERGLKVAMVYGDRDYRCNWLGGEETSLQAEYSGAQRFRDSGYEWIVTNSSYVGGLVRQAGRFSFSRVFKAGHYVHAQQPETVYRIFNRAIFNADIATGTVSASRNPEYRTRGPKSSFGIKNVLLPSGKQECSTWQVGMSCSQGQIAALKDGTGRVSDYLAVQPAS
ncbi:Alpha/Beta hydrolase protein [Bisporella sp. PMI_857]|nr:Alpha/Beta hydrolase protein [Bisporella sp. PMI_857]